MLLTQTLFRLLAAAIASAATMAWAAREGHATLVLAVAILFGIGLVTVALQTNRYWRRPELQGQDVFDISRAAKGNAGLMAVSYLWGGLSMLAIYLLADVSWRHGWQYGSGMVLIAALIFAGSAGRRPLSAAGIRMATALALAQLVGSVAGLSFLVVSGKLMTGKGDWAANYIFLTGGLTLVALTMIALRTQIRSVRRHPSGHTP